ncbi:predicted protein [Sclerotinia sclerotiorum 1980 UF-70]|uniref:Uncharacterized protein n=2 Tax=Sclerotinia sclerotiorum (strain ATCC 18683 / 1980 / Ss-1) TaxID=665079 RepID=A7EZ65_SCLS1|nr:predicted protein [Sclerotinia sclerotiorum 1980 UF-70]APA12342.1 hypothetical protein sscle_09g071120 [Sclerotinia sclerotiorum 1980 UF-70]EDN94757.1 predicted protein [Sclerotinia sclerotiorum 1980 UF-70]
MKRAKTSDSSPKQYVYVVMHETSLGYKQGDSAGVAGVFSTIEDATNCIKRVVSEEYGGLDREDEDTFEVTKRDGLLRWYSNDTREGDTASVYVEKHTLRAPGSEKQRRWDDDVGVGSGVEDGEEGEE